MSSRTANMLKAVFFTLLAIAMIIFRITGFMGEGKNWFLIAIVLSAILAIAFFRQAFQK